MKDIKGYEGRYAITKDGRVWSHPKASGRYITKGKWLKPKVNENGYIKYYLYDALGEQKNFSAHRLVAVSFIPNNSYLKEINHKNGIKDDNRIINLEWCTHLENVRHSIRMGLKKTWVRGEKMHLSKLKEVDIPKIKSLYYKDKLLGHEIAKIYKVNESTILRIIRKETWKHVK